MATIYGTELEFSSMTTIGTLLMVQFVAIPFSFLFGWLGKKIGTKKSILISLVIYSIIAIGGYFMVKEIHFWILGFGVAMVQGFGPFLFGMVSTVMGGSRLSIVSLIIFFIVGGYLLSRVNENEGMRVAKEEEERLVQASV